MAGSVHPYQALEAVPEGDGLNTKLVVAGLSSTHFTIADPRDPGMLDVVGLDSSVPNLVADFFRGDV
jgi:60 kDa SS-A/Ro ribonucleoprotein